MAPTIILVHSKQKKKLVLHTIQHLLHGGGGNHSYGGFEDGFKDEGSSSRRKTPPSNDSSPFSDPLTLCDAIMDTLSDKNTVDIGLYAMQ